MNDPEIPDPEERPEDETRARRGETREAFDELNEALKRAWKAGASDARTAARDAVPKAREEFARGFHDLAWGVAYLVGFGSSLAREVAPDCVNRGWDEGSEAGRKAAEAAASKCREKAERGEPPVPEAGEGETPPPDFSPA